MKIKVKKIMNKDLPKELRDKLMDNLNSELPVNVNKLLDELEEKSKEIDRSSFIDEIHEEASKLEKRAINEKKKYNIHIMHRLMDQARCLRVTANYLEGNNAG